MFKFVVAGALALMSAGAFAEEEKYYLPVHLWSQCEGDLVGQRMAYKIKEGLRASASMKVADTYGDSIVQISLVCLDPTPSESGTVSRYSYSITFINSKGFYDYSLNHGVGSCGTQRVDACAEGLVADIDEAVGKLKERIADGSFNPFAP